MSELVLVQSRERGIVSLTLNRPERRNALSTELLESLTSTIERLAAEPLRRVVILSGAGPVFSAGLDLREAADGALAERSAHAIAQALDVLRTTPLIVIAAVRGGAYAGGAGLMAACDIVLADAEAMFSFPEVRRGLLPALICDVLLRRVREGDLREILLTGEPIDAARACQLGLVQRVVPADRLDDATMSVARAIVAGGPEAVRNTKALLNSIALQRSETSNPEFIATHLAARNSNEAREGLAAFAEKRAPKWSL